MFTRAAGSPPPLCYNITSHLVLRSEIPSGICAKLHTVAASNNRVHVPWSLYYIACSRHVYIWVLFFPHIPFVVNHTINATPLERLQHWKSTLPFHVMKWSLFVAPMIDCVTSSDYHRVQESSITSGLHNLFSISGRITFTCMNSGRQWVQDILYFTFLLSCIHTLSLYPASTRLFGLLSTKNPHTVDK